MSGLGAACGTNSLNQSAAPRLRERNPLHLAARHFLGEFVDQGLEAKQPQRRERVGGRERSTIPDQEGQGNILDCGQLGHQARPLECHCDLVRP